MQLEIISGKITDKAVKLIVYGPEGIGKSTFASHFPTPLFIDTEAGTMDLEVNRTPRPKSWTMLMEQVKYIRDNPGQWQTLVIDTADWAETLCLAEICATKKVSGIEDFGYGKGYTYLEEEFGRLLNLLHDIFVLHRINIVMTAHAQMRKFEQPDELGQYDRWELKLEKKTSALVKEWADVVLFANYRTYVVNVDSQGAAKGKNKAQGGKRVMYATHHPCWDAKNRYGLADELPFEYSEIAHIPYSRTTTATPPAAPRPTTPPPAPVTTPVDDDDIPFIDSRPTDPLEGVPHALAELMDMNGVTVAEIQKVVGLKGYYPADTPISNYDPQFVAGVLVGAWEQVHGAIQANRGKAS